MITINMLAPKGLFVGSIPNLTEYLLCPVIGHGRGFPACSVFGTRKNRQHPTTKDKPGDIIPALSPELQERLMGKAPLRLVLQRVALPLHTWQERLECGHEVITYSNFEWDEKAHLVHLTPTAKRRRCQECKAIEASALPPKKPSLSERDPQRGKKAA